MAKICEELRYSDNWNVDKEEFCTVDNSLLSDEAINQSGTLLALEVIMGFVYFHSCSV